MSNLVIPNTSGFDWRDVRGALKRVLEAVAPLAQVQDEWKLEFDPQTSLGKVTGGLRGKTGTAHSGFVHSFMIGLANSQENAGDGGAFAAYGAGGTCDYNLDFAVWGFYDYGSWRTQFATATAISDTAAEKNATDFAESERRAMLGFLRMNPTLGLDSGRVRYVFPPVLESADNHPFSDGKRILVMQNTVRVRVRESFA